MVKREATLEIRNIYVHAWKELAYWRGELDKSKRSKQGVQMKHVNNVCAWEHIVREMWKAYNLGGFGVDSACEN
jgi:hypothetical protein